MQELPIHKLQSIRKLTCDLSVFDVQHCGSYFNDLEQLRLDELVFGVITNG